jgi:hypothetical protein
MSLDHGKGGDALGVARDMRDAGVDQQAGAVLHQRVAEIGEPCLLTGATPVEPGVGIGRR